MTTSNIRILLCIITIFAVAEARADVQIVDPNQPVAGQSQLVWAQTWWQWVLGINANVNPNLDQTGANASVNNGGAVFFLAGNFGGTSARTITVPSGKPVFFSVVNRFYGAFNGDGNFDPSPCATLSISCALAQVDVKKAKKMSVYIDGITLTNQQITAFRQTSTSFFTVALPGNNVFGVPVGHYNQCCATRPIWVQDGYYITLTKLSLGTHMLRFQGELSGFILDVTDTLNVVAP
jgi:hypothetical protein